MLYMRKLYFCLFIVLLHDYPYILLSLLCLGHLLFAIFIIKTRPCIEKVDNYRNFTQQGLFFCGTVCLFFLVNENNLEENRRIVIGWLSAIFLGGIFVMEMSFYFKELGELIYQTIKNASDFMMKKYSEWKNSNKVFQISGFD